MDEWDRNGGMPSGDDQGKALPENDAHMAGCGAGKPDAKRGFKRVRPSAEQEPMSYSDHLRGGFAGLRGDHRN